ncbi:unknown similar to AMEV031 [Mythimna separata entomopoxvirus 'L']|uniref:Uncharacterized protein n=1 Tax=Mythimna separata entomopoxvirus 'L' TaxID=1293572 RepID=A0A916KQ56_9POXV|nr:unknown similar to AMEV031 [Mythimna separata entomopoxvirus 'L']CCU56253.1 unknown similar to AMEV031 [Mythimna separata entomopoxvirus 'L']
MFTDMIFNNWINCIKLRDICIILSIITIIFNCALTVLELYSFIYLKHIHISNIALCIINTSLLLINIFINLLLMYAIYLNIRIIVKIFIILYIISIALYILLTNIKIYSYGFISYEFIHLYLQIFVNIIYISLVKNYYDTLCN